MKKISLVIAMLISSNLFAESDLFGYWLTPGSIVLIENCDKHLCAKIETIFVNDQQASEFFLHGNIAAKHRVPLVFVSGDAGLCEEVKKVSPNTVCHATMVGVGDSTISIQPEESRKIIQKKIKESLSGDLTSCLWNHPKSFSVKVRYNKQQNAYKASFYPGAELVDSKTVFFESKNYDDVMRYILFTI